MNNKQYSTDISLNIDNKIPVVTYICKVHDYFAATFVSPGIEKQLGYSQEEFLSHPGFWANNIHPEDRERVLQNLPAIL